LNKEEDIFNYFSRSGIILYKISKGHKCTIIWQTELIKFMNSKKKKEVEKQDGGLLVVIWKNKGFP
jgi:hypothetical protein